MVQEPGVKRGEENSSPWVFVNDTFTVNNGKRVNQIAQGQAVEKQQLWTRSELRQRGLPLAHSALAACTGSFWGHLFSSFWFGSLPSPTEESLPMRNGRSCRCNWSQSPQDLRTPGRHWSLVSLGCLLPFPLKETAALSFLHYLHFGMSCDWCIGVSSSGVIDIQLSIGWANHLISKRLLLWWPIPVCVAFSSYCRCTRIYMNWSYWSRNRPSNPIIGIVKGIAFPFKQICEEGP